MPSLDATPVVYLDHGATSWPKPTGVVEAVREALTESGGNPGRAAHQLSIASSRVLHVSRRAVASLLGAPASRDLLFQPSCTQALNLVLLGLLRPGDRVVASSVEHNAVARPLMALAQSGVDLVVVDADEFGVLDPDAVADAVAQAPTRAVVCQHAGNLTGAIQPIPELARIAHAHDALLLVDGAQAGGHLEVDLASLGADAWACSGHKGLLGPQGTGVLWLAAECDPAPLVLGGTGGGSSADTEMPEVRPDRYEAGTPNTPGIAGLGAAARYLAEHGSTQRAEEARLTRRLHEGILGVDGFRVLGPPPSTPRVPIVAVVHDQVDSDRLASALDRHYGIAARAGLHCAPWAHRSVGTLECGALRFGIGFGSTDAHVDAVIGALTELVRELA